jgi:hypothetical protein
MPYRRAVRFGRLLAPRVDGRIRQESEGCHGTDRFGMDLSDLGKERWNWR